MSNIIWKPSKELLESANVTRFMRRHGIKDYDELIGRSTSDIEWFWDAALKDIGIEWYEPYKKVLDMSEGFAWAKWFTGGKINIVHNCVDRHKDDSGTAFIWEGEDGDSKEISYAELYKQVGLSAKALQRLGIGGGDAVGLYMPMVPELIFIFFAAMKIGAHVVPIFSGFGPEAVAARLSDSNARILFTADGFHRKGKQILLKELADKVAVQAPAIKNIVVVKRLGAKNIPIKDGRDIFWNEFVELANGELADTAPLDSESVSMVLYTSGTTGKPKGTVHTHAGALAQISKELCYYFDVKKGARLFWATDIGWMMGPWEIIGVTALGGTFFIYEGAPNYPEPDRLWKMIERHKLTHLGLSPTVIRLLMRDDVSWVSRHDLSSLRILGSTEEPWDPDSYMWYFNNVGGGRCPVINISGGTEIVGCLLSPLPITELKPCTLRGPGLGMDVDVYNEEGRPVRGEVGYLVCKKPAPSMTKGFLGDKERYLDTYFSKWKGVWNHGDWAYIDEDGFWFLRGRADDVIKVGGKRVGPAEIESVLMEGENVAESAVIGVPDALMGEAIIAFVVAKGTPPEDLEDVLKKRVEASLGKTLVPKKIFFVNGLPKTRSAKIVRSVIKRVFLGQSAGDISSIENPEVIEEVAGCSSRGLKP